MSLEPRAAGSVRLAVALAFAASGCFRYEERMRPVRADECPPLPPSHAFSHVDAEPGLTGRLRGRIRSVPGRDSSSATIPDSVMKPLWAATVVVDAGVADARRAAPTDSTGHFVIDFLAPGKHVVSVRAIGYFPRTDTFVVGADTGAMWDVGLEPDWNDGCPGFMAVLERKRVWHWPWGR